MSVQKTNTDSMIAHTLHMKEMGRMAAKTVGFAIAEEDRGELDELVEYFGHGNRSEFLRIAMKRLRREKMAENLQRIQAQMREDMHGRVISPEEVTEMVKSVLRESA
jgi:Arc/MetJ-type ribon-helix-helix transcriptional regulator